MHRNFNVYRFPLKSCGNDMLGVRERHFWLLVISMLSFEVYLRFGICHWSSSLPFLLSSRMLLVCHSRMILAGI